MSPGRCAPPAYSRHGKGATASAAQLTTPGRRPHRIQLSAKHARWPQRSQRLAVTRLVTRRPLLEVDHDRPPVAHHRSGLRALSRNDPGARPGQRPQRRTVWIRLGDHQARLPSHLAGCLNEQPHQIGDLDRRGVFRPASRHHRPPVPRISLPSCGHKGHRPGDITRSVSVTVVR